MLGCVNVPRANDLMWSFVLVNLQGKSRLFCSPSTKSFSQLHGIIAILAPLYKPWPLVKCGATWDHFFKKVQKEDLELWPSIYGEGPFPLKEQHILGHLVWLLDHPLIHCTWAWHYFKDIKTIQVNNGIWVFNPVF